MTVIGSASHFGVPRAAKGVRDIRGAASSTNTRQLVDDFCNAKRRPRSRPPRLRRAHRRRRPARRRTGSVRARTRARARARSSVHTALPSSPGRRRISDRSDPRCALGPHLGSSQRSTHLRRRPLRRPSHKHWPKQLKHDNQRRPHKRHNRLANSDTHCAPAVHATPSGRSDSAPTLEVLVHQSEGARPWDS
jgi:hypothetical protein